MSGSQIKNALPRAQHGPERAVLATRAREHDGCARAFAGGRKSSVALLVLHEHFEITLCLAQVLRAVLLAIPPLILDRAASQVSPELLWRAHGAHGVDA